MKSTLKAPGTKRLKLKYDHLLSSFAVNINLRRYTEAEKRAGKELWEWWLDALQFRSDSAGRLHIRNTLKHPDMEAKLRGLFDALDVRHAGALDSVAVERRGRSHCTLAASSSACCLHFKMVPGRRVGRSDTVGR